MDEEKAEQTGGSHSVEPAISVSSEPKDELIDDVGKETTRELAEGSIEAPVLLASANPESPPANEPVTATEIEEAVACEAMKTEAVKADPAKTDAEVAEASPADAVDDAAAAPEAEGTGEAEDRAEGGDGEAPTGR